jgi:ribose 5-phosphate isomerase A
MNKDADKEKISAAREAVKLILPDQIIGLGTGSTANFALQEIGLLVKNGLRIQAVPTSIKTEQLARALNIPIVDINTLQYIDLTIDGADEFTTDLFLIKGGGGALLREKIVASMSKQEIIITDSSKKVEELGNFKVPLEVIPFASSYVMEEIEKLHGHGKIRSKDEKNFVTDQGNHIIDVDFGKITDPISLAEKLNRIVGLVCHGLFIHLTSKIIMGTGDKTVIFTK